MAKWKHIAGDGAFIMSTVTGTGVINSGDNVIVLGEAGTTSQSDCINLAGIMRIRASTAAFTTPQTGDIRRDTSSRIRLHSDGTENTVFSDDVLVSSSSPKL